MWLMSIPSRGEGVQSQFVRHHLKRNRTLYVHYFYWARLLIFLLGKSTIIQLLAIYMYFFKTFWIVYRNESLTRIREIYPRPTLFIVGIGIKNEEKTGIGRVCSKRIWICVQVGFRHTHTRTRFIPIPIPSCFLSFLGRIGQCKCSPAGFELKKAPKLSILSTKTRLIDPMIVVF